MSVSKGVQAVVKELRPFVRQGLMQAVIGLRSTEGYLLEIDEVLQEQLDYAHDLTDAERAMRIENLKVHAEIKSICCEVSDLLHSLRR